MIIKYAYRIHRAIWISFMASRVNDPKIICALLLAVTGMVEIRNSTLSFLETMNGNETTPADTERLEKER